MLNKKKAIHIAPTHGTNKLHLGHDDEVPETALDLQAQR